MTFTGDSAGNALALRTSDGTTLWHSAIGRVGNSPITYELDGRQYMLVAWRRSALRVDAAGKEVIQRFMVLGFYGSKGSGF